MTMDATGVIHACQTYCNTCIMHKCSQSCKAAVVPQVGASNELPESEELDALYDRFLIRRQVSPVSNFGLNVMLQAAADNNLAVSHRLYCTAREHLLVSAQTQLQHGTVKETRKNTFVSLQRMIVCIRVTAILSCGLACLSGYTGMPLCSTKSLNAVGCVCLVICSILVTCSHLSLWTCSSLHGIHSCLVLL